MTTDDQGVAVHDRPPRRRRWVLTALGGMIGVALVAVGVFANVSGSGGGDAQALIPGGGRPAPGFTLPELLDPGHKESLADFRGRALLLNFWASWCFPCQTEMPLLESAYRSEGGAVQFVGVDTDDTRSAAIAFLSKTHVTYPSLSLPSEGDVSSAYDLVGLPITVFVSPSGTLIGRHIGQLDAPTLTAALKEAFGVRT